MADGGEGEIRTHGPRKESPVFKTGALNHSATSPTQVFRHFALRNGGEGGIRTPGTAFDRTTV